MSQTPDITPYLSTPINKTIAPEIVTATLSSPPFISIAGTFNARDLSNGGGGGESKGLKPRYAFRSGTLENVKEEGFAALRRLGIGKVFDLRSERERAAGVTAGIEGVEVVWIPSTIDNPIRLESEIGEGKEEGGGRRNGDWKFGSITEMYLSILESHQCSFEAVLRHVLDHPDRPFLFYCTGKDRTGVLAILIHSLAGAPAAAIQRDYSLSRIGVEEVRGFLISKVSGGKGLDLQNPAIRAVADFPADLVESLLQLMHARYGGVRGYARSVLGFDEDELVRICVNLRM